MWRRLLRLLLKAVQQDHFGIDDPEDHPRDAPALRSTRTLPKQVIRKTTYQDDVSARVSANDIPSIHEGHTAGTRRH